MKRREQIRLRYKFMAKIRDIENYSVIIHILGIVCKC